MSLLLLSIESDDEINESSEIVYKSKMISSLSSIAQKSKPLNVPKDESEDSSSEEKSASEAESDSS